MSRVIQVIVFKDRSKATDAKTKVS